MKLVIAIAMAAAACVVEREAQARPFPGAVATETLIDGAAVPSAGTGGMPVRRVTRMVVMTGPRRSGSVQG